MFSFVLLEISLQHNKVSKGGLSEPLEHPLNPTLVLVFYGSKNLSAIHRHDGTETSVVEIFQYM